MYVKLKLKSIAISLVIIDNTMGIWEEEEEEEEEEEATNNVNKIT